LMFMSQLQGEISMWEKKTWISFRITNDCLVLCFRLQCKWSSRNIVRILHCEKKLFWLSSAFQWLASSPCFSFHTRDSLSTRVNPQKIFPVVSKKSWLKCFQWPSHRSWNSVALKPSQLPRQRSENCFIPNSVKRSGKSEMIGESIDGVDELSGCYGNNWNVLEDGGGWRFGMDGTSESLSVISKTSISFIWNWREPVKIVIPYSLVSLV
jgi:hypothetical protein